MGLCLQVGMKEKGLFKKKKECSCHGVIISYCQQLDQRHLFFHKSAVYVCISLQKMFKDRKYYLRDLGSFGTWSLTPSVSFLME